MGLDQFFGVSTRTIRNWRAAGAPLSDADKLLTWLKNQPRASESKGVAARLSDSKSLSALRKIIGGAEPAPPPPQKAPPKVKEEIPEADTGKDATSLQQGRINKLNLEARRLRLIVAEQEGLYVLKSAIEEEGVAIGALLSAELGSAENDLPGQIAGMNEGEIRVRLRARFDSVLERIQTRLIEL